MEEIKVALLIFGAPGSGKGTQARLLAEFLTGLKVISMGDLLRNEVSARTEIGEEVEKVMKEGVLVSDLLVCEMLLKQLRKVGNSFLLDGFPRNMLQAEFLTIALQLMGCEIDIVLKLEVDPTVVENRLKGRLTCKKCGKVSNVGFGETVCSDCGSNYISRDDDVVRVVRQRIVEYEQMIDELERYYTGKVAKIDGNRSIGEVSEDIKKLVNYLKTS